MTKLQFLARTLGHLRRQASNRLSRHAIVAGAACGGEAGSTLREIAGYLGEPDPSAIGPQVGSYAGKGLLKIVPTAQTGPRRYTVTATGYSLIEPMLRAQPQPQVQPIVAAP